MQVQCPNCGGYRTAISGTRVKGNSGREVVGCGFLMFLPIVVGFGAACVVAWQQQQAKEARGVEGDPFMPLWVGLAVFFAVAIVSFLIDRSSRKGDVRAYRGGCAICGYTWLHRSDEAPPEVTVRPDLIQKGYERLQEEEREEEERRRML